MDRLTQENFDLKLKIHMLEKVVARNTPEALRVSEARERKVDCWVHARAATLSHLAKLAKKAQSYEVNLHSCSVLYIAVGAHSHGPNIDEAAKNLVKRNKEVAAKEKETDRRIHRNNLE